VRPGAYDISSMSTVLNALYTAGGPTEVGSMRIARHFRGQQLIQDVDLYELILHGVHGDMQRLQAGDTVLVPPVSKEVTVEGMVHRPAIYELKGERSLAEVLAMAGGVLPTGTLRHVEVERIEAHEKRTMLSLDLPDKAGSSDADRLVQEFQVQDKDVIRIFPILPYNEKSIFLTGHVARPGKYSYRDGMTLTDLIKSSTDLLPEPAQYAEIIRLASPDYRPTVISINVSADVKVEAIPLAPLDTVRFYGKYDFQDAPSVTVYGEVRDPGLHKLNGESRVRDAIFAAGGLTPDAMQGQAQVYHQQADSTMKVFTIDIGKALAGDATANVALGPTDTLVIHSNLAKVDPLRVYVQGQVAMPGAYPWSSGMTASDLVKMAGGFTNGAFKDSADLSRFEVANGSTVNTPQTTIAIGKAVEGEKSVDIELHNGDVLSIRQITGWDDIGSSVTVKGEVGHAGGFGIQDGERLSSVLKRAGGFREHAYAEGIILERDDVRQIAEKTRAELIDRIESEQFGAKQSGPGAPTTTSAADLQEMEMQKTQILDRLKRQTSNGRIALNINKDIKSWEGSEADIELRAGDTITIPKKYSFVVVSGQVYGASAVNFSANHKVSWYIERAGGMTDMANRGNVFVVRADGTVIGRGTKSGLWGKGNVLDYKAKPGDAIVVPEKILGNNKAWQYLAQTAQILSSFALMAGVLTRL
jgi:polysaccharide biosynthesis/export protein